MAENIYNTEELEPKSTTEYFSVVRWEGDRQVRRAIKFYNLDMIISVGYRVNSKRGTQFRIWATKVLKDHIIKGYSIYKKRFQEQSIDSHFRENDIWQEVSEVLI